jgi:hypothetical protein
MTLYGLHRSDFRSKVLRYLSNISQSNKNNTINNNFYKVYKIPVGARFSAPVQTGPGAHPAFYTRGNGSFPGVNRPGRGVARTIHPHLVLQGIVIFLKEKTFYQNDNIVINLACFVKCTITDQHRLTRIISYQFNIYLFKNYLIS